MVKLAVFLMVALCGASALAQNLKSSENGTLSELKCDGPTEVVGSDWIDMHTTCTDAVRQQIQMEVDASYVYLAMGSYFARDEVNMPGFSKLFFEHATEERSHALALIEYLLMRGPEGQDQKFTRNLIKFSEPPKTKWTSGLEALKDALAKEKEVTQSIKNVISICERYGEDYHLSDHLTGEFLEEQYRGMRELAGKISTLSKMTKTSDNLGHFLFDKELMG